MTHTIVTQPSFISDPGMEDVHTETLHPPGYPVVAAVFKIAAKETQCII
jgi:hypothetical protein